MSDETYQISNGLKLLNPHAIAQLSQEYITFERDFLMKLIRGEAVLPDPLPIYERPPMPKPTQELNATTPINKMIRTQAVNSLINLKNDDSCYLSSQECISLGLYHVNIAKAHRLGDRVLVTDLRSNTSSLILDVKNTDWINGENE